MGPRVNKQGQSELLLTLDCISSSRARVEPIARARTQQPPPGEIRQEWALGLRKAGARGAPQHHCSFTGKLDEAPASLEAVKSAGALLYFFASFLRQTNQRSPCGVLPSSPWKCSPRFLGVSALPAQHLSFYVPSPLWYTPILHFCFGLDYVFQANILSHLHTPLPAPSGFHPTPIKIINIARFQTIY